MNKNKLNDYTLRPAFLLTSLGIAMTIPQIIASHGPFPTTTGVYRIPYANGVDITVGADHHDHGGPNGNKDRVDMSGDNAGALTGQDIL